MAQGGEGKGEGSGGGRRGLSGTLRWGAWGGRSGRNKGRVGREGKGEGGRRNNTGCGGEEEEEEEEEVAEGSAPSLEEAIGRGPAWSSFSSSIPATSPLSARPARFRMEKRVTSGGLVLRDEQPVAAVEYRRLLDIILKEKGRKTGYCFVKEKRHKVGR